MAATVVAGNDFGLLDSSLAILKRGDQTNQNKVGGDKNLFINASNGNLVVQQQDVYLPSLGEDFQLVRTYNSQAKLNGESNWSLSSGINLKFQGPLITIEKGDGSYFEYHLDDETGLWVSTDGAGAYEAIEHVTNENWPKKTDPTLDPSIANDHFGYVLTRADQSKMYFDARGKLMASVDTNGVRMDYRYDKTTLTQIIDDQGHEINFVYDKWGRLTSVTDEQVNTLVEYTYSKAHDYLEQVTDRNGHVTKYSYDNKGLLVAIELPTQQVVDGKLETTQARTLSFTYEMGTIPNIIKGWGPTLSSIIDAEDGLTTFEYFDDDYNLALENTGSTRIVDGLGNARAYSNTAQNVQWRQDNGFYAYYNSEDQLAAYQSGLIREQHAITYTYSDTGYLLEAKDQQGYKTQYQYNASGDLISASDNNAWALTHSDSEYYRDLRQAQGIIDVAGLGKLVSQLTDNDKAVLIEAHTSHYEYDTSGNLVRFLDNNSSESVFVYDEFNNLLSSTSPEAARLTSDSSVDAQAKREALGFTAQISDLSQADIAAIGELFTSRFVYDENQNLIQRTDNGGDITRFEYDAYGNLSKQTVHLDNTNLNDPATQQVTQYFYDMFGNNIETVDAQGSHTFSSYDHFGNVFRSIDGNGGITTYIYDNDNRLTAMTDAEGNSTHYGYDAVGNVISTTDANGHTVISVYDKNNRLITVIDPSDDDASKDRTTRFTYDIIGNQTSVTNAQGFTSTYQFDTRRQLVELNTPNVVDVDGSSSSYSTRYSYDGLGNVLTNQDNNGNITAYVYNQDNLLVQQEQPNGHITQFIYDENNNQIQIIAGVQLADAKRQILKFVHDEENQLIEQTDAQGNKTTFALNAVGKQISVLDANGNTTTYQYDANNRAIKIILPEVTDPQTGNPVSYTQEFTYDANNNVISTTNENQETTHYFFDKNNRQVLVEDANGVFTRFSYDAKGQRTQVEMGVDMVRDLSGNLVNLENQVSGQTEYQLASTDGAQVSKYVYDEFGQILSETDGLGHALATNNTQMYQQLRIDLGLDALVENLSDADKANIENLYRKTFEYDNIGNLTQQTDQQGNVTRFEYDALNRAIKTINALSGETTFKYDGNGNQVQSTDALGRVIQLNYDAYNRVIESVQAQDTTAEITSTLQYDAFGNLLLQTEAVGTLDQRSVSYEYDLNNRQTRAINAEGHDVSYQYDALGNRIMITDAKGNSSNYFYDALNRNIKVIDAMSFETRFEYDGIGNRIAIMDANGNRVKYQYDPTNQLVRTVQLMGNGEDRITEFAYDVRGNQIKMTTATGSENQEVTQFFYDAQNNLRRVEDAKGGISTQDYDRLYNQISSTDANGNTTTTSYDALNRAVIITDELNNQTKISYDAVGNQLTITDANKHEVSYEYDERNRRIVSRDAYGVETHYQYDTVSNQTRITYANGTSEQVVESFEYYDDGQLKARTDGENSRTEYFYDKNNNTTQMKDPEGYLTHYTLDENNRVTSIEDAEGGVVSYLYDNNGNRTQVIDQEGHKTSSYYNAANQISVMIDAEGFATSYIYDENGNRTASTLFMTAVGVPTKDELSIVPTLVARVKDQTSTYAYDGLNRLIEITDAENFTTAYDYDAVGNRTSTRHLLNKQSGEFAQTYSFYDDINRLTHNVSAEGLLTTFGYDDVGNRTSVNVFDSAIEVNSVNPQAPTAVEGDRVRTTTYSYDKANRLAEETSAEGYKTQYKYSKRGNRTQVLEALGLAEQRITQNVYDDANRVIETTQALGSAQQVTTVFDYYDDGQLKTRTDASGTNDQVITGFIYDKNNRLTQQEKPSGQGGIQVESFSYDAAGNRQQWISAKGTDEQRIYNYGYDKNNQLTSEELPFNATQTITNEYGFDGAGNRTEANLAVGTPEARQQSWTFDKNNRVISALNSAKVETTFVYDGAGNQTEIHENANFVNGEAQRITLQEFDLDNRLSKLTSAQGYVTDYSYDALGNQTLVSQLVDKEQGIYAQTRQYFDDLGRQTHVLTAEGHLTQFEYDALGNLTQETKYLSTAAVPPSGATPQGRGDTQLRSYSYNQLNQLESQTNANGRIDTFSYDARGNRITAIQGANLSLASGPRTTHYQYNDANYLLATSEPLENNQLRTTEFTVDSFGQVLTRIDAAQSNNSRTSYFSYDAQGNVLSEARVNGIDAQTGEEQLITSTYRYNAFGDLNAKTLAMGEVDERTTSYGYDAGGRLVLATNGEQEQAHYQYDAMGNQRFVTSAYGTHDTRTVEFQFDLDHRQVAMIDAENIETRYQYDGANNQTAMIEAFGTQDARLTKSTYDLDNRLTVVTDAMGYTTQFEYDALGNQIQISQLVAAATDQQPARYAQTNQYFDIGGRLTHSINPEGYLSTYRYDEFNQLLSRSDYFEPVLVSLETPVVPVTAKAKTSRYQYDISGNLVSETDAVGVENISKYDLLGNRTEYHEHWNVQTQQGERVTVFAYDKQDRLSSRIDAAGSDEQVETGFVYNNHGELLTKLEAKGTNDQRQTDYQYDDAGRTISESQYYTDAQGNVQELRNVFTYDEAGNLSQQKSGLWNGANASLTVLRTQTFSYDKNNRLITDTNGENETTRYVYDALGNQTAVHLAFGSSDQRNNYFEYNLLGQVTIATDGSDVQTRYQYDGFGNKTQTIQAAGVINEQRITQYVYDLNSNLTDVTDPLGGHTHYVYDYLGNQVQTVDANGGVQNSAFDLLGRLSVSVTAGGIKTVVKYDELGNKISEVTGWDDGSLAQNDNLLAHSQVSKTYQYDTLGRQTIITGGNGFSTVMDYDLVGNQTSITRGIYLGDDASKKALEHINVNNFSYDQAGRMQTMEDALGNITTYSYNAVGDRISTTQASNGLFNTLPRITTYQYDAAGRQTHAMTNGGSHTVTTYNQAGDVSQESILQSNENGLEVWINTSKHYDGNGNVIDSIDDAGTITHYVYDAMGNQTDLYVAYGLPEQRHTAMEYDLNNRKTADIDAEGHATRFEFDALGNQTVVTDALERKAYYYYNTSNQMVAMVDAQGTVTQFEYDAQGNQKSYIVLAAGLFSSEPKQAAWAALLQQQKLDLTQVESLFVNGNQDRLTAHNYDANGNKISTSESDGSINSFVYDAMGNMVGQTLFANVSDGGRTTAYQYDLNNRLKHFVDVDKTVTTFEYDAAGNKTAETVLSNQDVVNPSRRTEYIYNLNNQNISQISDAGGLDITQYSEYDIVGNELAYLDANGNRTQNVYDKNNRLTSSIDAQGNISANGYDKVGNRTSATNGNLLTTHFEYDNNNRQTKVILPEASHHRYENGEWLDTSFRATTTISFDAFGNEVQTISNGEETLIDGVLVNDGYSTTRWFDANGRAIALLDSRNVLTKIEYNQFGEVAFQHIYLQTLASTAHDPAQAPNVEGLAFQTTQMEYDNAGRLTQKTFPEIEVTQLLGSNGSTPSTTSKMDKPTEIISYDAFGNQASLTDKNGNISYQFYDALDRQIAVIDPAGYLTEWRFDAQGNTLEQFQNSSIVATDAITAGTLPAKFEFINDSNVQYQIIRQYDAANRLIRETMPQMATWSRTNGADNELVTTAFSYDDAGNKIASTRAHGTDLATTEYFYFDGNNRQVAFVDSSRVLSTSKYDGNGNVTDQKRYFTAIAESIVLTEVSAAQLEGLVVVSAQHDQVISNQYDAVNRLTAESTQLKNDSIDKTYKYDARGNQTSSTEHERENLALEIIDGQELLLTRFETRSVFDGANQLIKTLSADGTGSVFEYDVLGNKTLSYTGDINSVPTAANNISATVSNGLNITWENGERAFVVYDTQPHTVNSESDFTALVNDYKNQTGIASNGVTLNLEPGDTQYFRVVTVDRAGNWAVGQEYRTEMPGSYSSLEIKEENNQRVAYVEFVGDISAPAIELAGGVSPLLQVTDNLYKAVLPALNSPEQTFQITWNYGDTRYSSDAIGLNAQQPHHVTNTLITPSAVGDKFRVSTQINLDAATSLESYETMSAEWVSVSNSEERYVGIADLTDLCGDQVCITTGTAEAPIPAGNYTVTIRANSEYGSEVLQSFEYTLDGQEGSTSQLSIMTTDVAEDQAWVILNGEASLVKSESGFFVVDAPIATQTGYTLLTGQAVTQSHNTTLINKIGRASCRERV